MSTSRPPPASGGRRSGSPNISAHTLVHAEAVGIGSLTLRLPGENALAAGQEIFVTPREDRVHRFEGDGRRIN